MQQSHPESLNREISGSIILLQTSAANRYAEDIYNSFSWLGDDENKVYAVFRALKDKVQVAQVAKAYQIKYKANLIDVLSERFNQQEVAKVLGIVRELPNYRTA